MASKRRVVDVKKDEYGTYEDVKTAYSDGKGGGIFKLSAIKGGYVDYAMILVVFFLAIFGLIMLFSTSSYEAGLKFDDQAFYLKKQIKAVIVGIAGMFFVSVFPDYHFYKKISLPFYLFAMGMILLIIPFGSEAKGAKRWLRIGGLSIQPAEIVKIAIIIFAVSVICVMRDKAASWKGMGVFMLTVLPPVLMIFKITSNFSSAAIILGIAAVILFVATPGYAKFILMVAGGVALIYGGIYYILNYADPSSSFRFARIYAWNDIEAYADSQGYQTLQSLYAIGSGGIFGKGLGQSMQKTGFIPEAQNDMIFSIICEELGIFGGIAVILMFFLLLWRMMIVANNAPDLFGSLIVVGVMGHIALQVVLNIAVVTNVVPNTGITLPFISYGGSAVVMQLAEIGMVMNVARRIKTV